MPQAASRAAHCRQGCLCLLLVVTRLLPPTARTFSSIAVCGGSWYVSTGGFAQESV